MKAIQKIKSNLSKIIKVLRHGILSLYSYIRKFIPWRSCTYIQNLRNVRIAGMSSSIMFGLLALAIIIPLYNVSGTEDTEAATSYNEASITLTAVRSSATITADANTIGSSSFALISSNLTSSDTAQYAEYNIKTTNATGYTIGIATNTASTSTNLTSGSNTLSSLAYNTTTMNGISSSDYNNLNTTSYNNTWALYPGTVENSANSKFYPISNNTITMGTTTAANSTVTSSNTYKVGLAARITMNQASGTYTTTAGNFKVTAVGNAAAYTISYNANGGNGAPSTQSSTSYSQQSVTLSNTTPTKTGYDFLGWCTKQTSDQTTQSNGSTACTNAGGTYYAKGGTFYIDETTKNITTLYAIWYLKDITVTGVFGGSGVTGITFANQTYGNKSITTNNDTTTLKYGVSYTITGTYSSGYEFSSWAATAGSLGSASSDSTTYSTTTAATLTLTGKSSIISLGYMQDLTLDACKVATTSEYRATDKRDGKIYSVRYINDYCWMTQNLRYLGDTGSATGTMTIGNNNSNASNTSTPITLYSLNKSNVGNFGAYSDHCDSTNSYNYACVYDSGSTTTGVWYNYYAATAGTITSSSNNTAATKDICPAGWHLPTGPNTTSNTDFNKLVGNTTSGWQSATTGLTAFSAVAGGYYFNGSLSNTGGGYWWSATASDPTTRYRLYYNSSDGQFYGDNLSLRYSGDYVRCVMTPTMQSIAVSDVAEGEEVSLPDERDGKIYTVKKINGLLWMTRNLAIGCNGSGSTYGSSVSSKSLTSSNSNVSDTWSTPTALLSTSANSSSTSGYTTAAMRCSSKYGAWYNYAAATAGTITSSSNNTAATKDICPAGWHLPTGPSTTSNTDFNKLVGNTTSGWQSATTGLTAFSAVAGGYYVSGSLSNTGEGYWWSATASNTASRYYLRYDSSNGQFLGNDADGRYVGTYVRCVMTPPPTMQSIAVSDVAEGEEVSLPDERDGQIYTVKKINGQLWMTQNLRYLGDTGSATGTMTIGNNNSNASNTSTPITLYSLDSSDAGNFGAYSGHCDDTNSRNYACVYDSGSTTTGVWYNYYAATAGTIASSYESTAATKDICPAGWHLPTGPNTTSGTDINKLVGNTTSGWQSATTGLTAFSAVARGGYSNGSLSDTGGGVWWSATAYSTSSRYGLYYSSSGRQFRGNGSHDRSFGYYVRCVRTS